MPNDAAELQRVSTEQQALQKHLEAARKQARQHSMLIQVIGQPRVKFIALILPSINKM